MRIRGRRKQAENPVRAPRDQSQRAAPVFSYYSSRTASPETARNTNRQIPAVRLKQSPWWISYMPSLVSLAILAVAALFVTTLSTTPRIDVRAPDTNTYALQDMAVYHNAVADMLKGSPLNRSKLTISSDKIAGDIQSRFPELGEVVVAVPLLGRRPVVEIQPAQPALILSSSNGTYVIDNTGQAILRSNQLKSSLRDSLPIVRDEAGLDVQLGNHALPTDSVRFIRELALQFKARDQRVESYTLPAIAHEVHIYPSGRNYYVKSNTDTDARVQAGAYFALISKLEGEGVQVREYIDVRVEERAFYK